MILLHRAGEDAGGSAAAALFGSGRVGSSILDALSVPGDLVASSLPFPWTGGDGLRTAAADVASRMRDSLPEGGRAAVIWAAGACGFSATEEAAAAELVSFGEVLGIARTLAAAGNPVDFHLLSSGGGLFEGRSGILRTDEPRPKRAYGRLKLEEERRALAEPGVRVRIYRVSSVYGPLRPGHRLGLVCTLVGNTVAGKATPLFGDPATRRDYVFAPDVGAFVARTVREGGDDPAPRTLFLASGRATSIAEAVATVGRVLGREPLVEIRDGGDNRSDITFSPTALPAGFAPVDLETGVRAVRQDLLARGEYRTRPDSSGLGD